MKSKNKINKNQLIEIVTKKIGIKKKEAKKAVDLIFNTIVKNTKKGVKIAGFGSFVITKRKSKRFKNPKNGIVKILPERNAVKFKAGSNFKRYINGI